MKISRLPAFLPLIAVLLLQSACSGTSGTAPQSAAAAHEVGEEVFGTRILLASRDSDFKVEIARRIGEALRDEPVYVKFIGIKQLANEAGSDYTAIILMTRCTSWSMDPEAKVFLEKNPELSNIVLLITSGDGVETGHGGKEVRRDNISVRNDPRRQRHGRDPREAPCDNASLSLPPDHFRSLTM